LYLPQDHFLHCLIFAFLDEPFLVSLPCVERGGVRLPCLYFLPTLPRGNPTDAVAVLGVSHHLGQYVPLLARFKRPALLGRRDLQDPLLHLLNLLLIVLGPALLQLFWLAGIEEVMSPLIDTL
jgi:hypothetical protein